MSNDSYLYADKIDVLDILKKVREFGAVIVPNFFSIENIQELDRELTPIWNQMDPKDQWCIGDSDNTSMTKNSYKSGKVIRISPKAYHEYPVLIKSFVHNIILNNIVDSFYGRPNNKFMQVFAYHDFLLRDHEWVDGITHSAALHFDPYQSLKFATYLTDASEENGMTRIIPGSHDEGKHFRNNLKSSIWEGKEILNCHKPFDQSRYSEKDVIWPSVEAGTLIVFDTDAWHAGGEVKVSGLERKCIIFHNRKS